MSDNKKNRDGRDDSKVDSNDVSEAAVLVYALLRIATTQTPATPLIPYPSEVYV